MIIDKTHKTMTKVPKIRVSLAQYWAYMLLVAMPFCFSSCKKDKEDTQPKHDVELTFNRQNIDNIHLDTIKKYADDNSVRYIYMVPENNGWDYYATSIKGLRSVFQKRIDIAPEKVRGKGAFQFTRGSAARYPEDSLWFVKNGWKVNNLQYTTRL